MKPADREFVHSDLSEAAVLLASIVELTDCIANGNDESGYLVAAIKPLAIEAHDRLDLVLRALGNPGIGFRGAVAQRLEAERPKGVGHATP